MKKNHQSKLLQSDVARTGFLDELVTNVSQWAENINEEWFGEGGAITVTY